MIVLDTTTLIDFYKRDASLAEVFKNITEDLGTTIINYHEIFIGLNPNDKKYNEELEFYNKLFSNLNFFNLDKESVKKGSSIFW